MYNLIGGKEYRLKIRFWKICDYFYLEGTNELLKKDKCVNFP